MFYCWSLINNMPNIFKNAIRISNTDNSNTAWIIVVFLPLIIIISKYALNFLKILKKYADFLHINILGQFLCQTWYFVKHFIAYGVC